MEALQALAAQISECRRCPRLVEWREQVAREKRAAFSDQEYWGRPVPGFGDPAARLLVVGLAPAAHGANRTGRMFTGDRSGDWLYRAMWRAGYANQPTSVSIDDGLELTDAFVTAPVKCAPPANKPLPSERDACRPWFDAEVALLPSVEVVVALGGFGYTQALGLFGWNTAECGARPKFAHGVEVELPDGKVLLGSYHVSQQNTFTGRLTEEMLDSIFARATEITSGHGRS
ncbi:MAG TPA: uracil-DNA glycosylase [Microthrixaceae bacterium]|jgi:uracil-DNA glycosylase family 4|nr:uracil-DNA glycosylase [Microthrixaceae bacterium]